MTVRVYVLDVPEFQPIVEFASRQDGCCLSRAHDDYWLIEADRDLRFDRRGIGLKPALWYAMFTGGFEGVITEFGRDVVHLVSNPACPA